MHINADARLQVAGVPFANILWTLHALSALISSLSVVLTAACTCKCNSQGYDDVLKNLNNVNMGHSNQNQLRRS